MAGAATASILPYLAQSRDNLQAAIDDPDFAVPLEAIADRVAGALEGGGKVLLAGNGGSAGDAQHIAGEFLSRFHYDRALLAAVALTTDISMLTAIGRSSNILRAIGAARQKGLAVIGFTGRSGGATASQYDLCLRAPSDSTPLIQQMHITAAHIVCGLFEERLFPHSETSRGYGAAAK
jgi:D-sedoheptulose 7-phosphate isomerase